MILTQENEHKGDMLRQIYFLDYKHLPGIIISMNHIWSRDHLPREGYA